MSVDLSVLIPARREMFLRETVQDVLAHKTGKTNVIVVLDGEWAHPALEDHPDVHLIYLPNPIGQRAAVNLAARMTNATYVMKLDAHCSVAPGFDTELMASAEALGRDVTQVPTMFNLHCFDWQCNACGLRTYQGPTLTVCATCGKPGPFERVMVWKPRKNRKTDFMRFDSDLHFQYWSAFRERPESEGDIVDIMTSVGATFFMRRDRFWELGGLDESHGSWGQFGVEVACKSFLSGGRHVVNKLTWFAHMFRTQGGDFGFPYPLSGGQVETARKVSKSLWLDNTWPGQTRPLSALLEKFAPVPGWHDTPEGQVVLDHVKTAGTTFHRAPALKIGPSKGVCFYTDNLVDPTIAEAVQRQLKKVTHGLTLVSTSLQPIRFGTNLSVPWARGTLTMFRQILMGLEALDTDVVYMAEHDVLYHASHFDFVPPRHDRYYYNRNTWKVDAASGRALFYLCDQTLGLCGNRKLLVDHYRARVERVQREGFSRAMGFEPGTHRLPRGVDDVPAESWMSTGPNIDIRHGKNLTQSRWAQSEFRNQRFCQGWKEAEGVPLWGQTQGRFPEFLKGLV